MNSEKKNLLIGTSFIAFIIVFFIFLFVFLAFVARASATTTEIFVDKTYVMTNSDSYSGWSFDSPNRFRDIEIAETCANPFLAVSAYYAHDQSYTNAISFDNETVDLIGHAGMVAFYGMSLADWSSGNYKFNTNLTDYYSEMSIAILCNVDPVNPYNTDLLETTIIGTGTGNPVNYVSPSLVIPEGSAWLSAGNFSYKNWSTTHSSQFIMTIGSGDYWVTSLGLIVGDGVENKSWTVSSYDWKAISYGGVILNYKEPVPPIGWLLAWGHPSPLFSATSTFAVGGTKIFPISYNVCNVVDQFDLVVLKPRYSNGANSPAKALLNNEDMLTGKCKGLYTFYDYFEKSNEGSVYFEAIFYENINGLMTRIEDFSILSNTRNYTSPYNEADGYILSLDNDPLLIHVGGREVATTTLSFQYDFSLRNIASTTIILWDYVNATTTATLTGPFTQGVGTGSFDLPSPRYDLSKIYQYYVISEGDNNIQSNQFTVAWYFNRITGSIDDLENEMYLKCQSQEPFFSIANMCEDIEGGLISDIGCQIRMGLAGVGRFFFKPNCTTLVKFSKKFDDLKRSFPFNVYFDITDAMDEAIGASLTSTSTAGSIDVPFIRQTATSSEFYMLPVASSSSFVNLIGQDNYNTYKMTLGFIWWIAGALIVYLIVIKI